MYNEHGQLRRLSSHEIVIYFLAGLLFNTFGNGITVAANMGSAPWTASAANLTNLIGTSISVFLFFYGVFAATLVCILQRSIDWPHVIGNIIFVVAFSSIIGIVSTRLTALGMGTLPIAWRTIIDFIGVIFIGFGVSITQRLQFILHPIDDLTNLTRFMFFRGNAAISQIINFSFPMLISMIVWAFSGELVAINVGTLFSFFFQGMFVGYADHHVFGHLAHRLNNIKVSH
ncbi:hypothetical protein [Weissella paramesenteroides]|uniref:hypothetical protein n=1 Tax=Weissella paramesenteroides TaxID=1249 RepID=UPI001F5B1883|nr:hypothetical protein [Weissella paramesenteroides]